MGSSPDRAQGQKTADHRYPRLGIGRAQGLVRGGRRSKVPLEQGVSKAYRAWATSISRKEDELEMDDFLWEREVTDFVETLRKAGIKTFVYTNQSTAVMENLHQFAAAGCTMEGLCTITRQENRWGDEEPTKVMGIRFSLD